jgi:hypothetical protein
MKKRVLIITIVFISCFQLFAQETADKSSKRDTYTELGADLVSSYLWRGIQIDASPNVQGWGEYGIGNFIVGAWASTNFAGSYAETDLYAGYSLGNLSFTFTNYFVGTDKFFEFSKNQILHVGELGLQYTLSEKFPLQISVATCIYGSDKKIDSYDLNGDPVLSVDNNFSTYFELAYPISHGETGINLVVGGATHESYFYDSDALAIINVGMQLSKEIKVNERFSLPISFSLMTNPHRDKIYAAFGISF